VGIVTVLVSMPFYGAPELLERAVRSVLAQTHEDLQLLVVADGEDPPLSGISDSRLEVYRIPENRGAYFAQAVALGANPHAWYAPHGADDWSDPDHLETLLSVEGDAVAAGAVWFHRGAIVSEHIANYEVGAFATKRLRELGGYNPAERIGQDSLMLRLLRLTGGFAATNRATYHRVKRAGALTTAPATKIGSPGRNAMRRRNRAVWAAVRGMTDLREVRAYRARLVPTEISAEVAFHVERLSERLGQVAAA
jgi:glycosyltransferase involved in cell wall biosynthesis